MYKPEEIQGQRSVESADGIDLKKIFNKLIDNWHWFLLSVLVCLSVAYLYARYTPPLYKVNAKVLINEQKKDGIGGQGGALMDLGSIMGSNSSVDNEVEILKTPDLLENVVRKMKLNVVYGQKASLLRRELYQAPFQLQIVKGVDSIQTTRLEVTKLTGDKIRVSSDDFEKEVSWNQPFEVENVGVLMLLPENGQRMTNADYYVTVTSIDQRVAELAAQLTIELTNKQVSIVNVSLNYAVQKKGEEILHTLIENYETSNVEDKNAVADSTYQFITKRLSVIGSELGDVENKVERFKQKNNLADMSEQGKLLVQNTGMINNELAKAETQISILSDLEVYLSDKTKNERVFPTSLLPSDMVFSNLMEQYNSLLQERDRTLMSVTQATPFVQNLNNQIAQMRNGILSNIQNTKNTYVVTRDKLKRQLKDAQSQISDVPQVEKNYLQLARNQQIKQELYIFLMQKAEETAISKTSNTSIAKIIARPKAEGSPISPRKNIIYFVGIFLGLLIPMLAIIIRSFFSSAVTSRADVTGTTDVPILGEISHNSQPDDLIVSHSGRSAIAEQFRALRSNLSFYLKDKDKNIILLTSSMSGEGKSFTAINLANVLALLGKKVLLMEMDLRKPGLSIKLKIKNDMGFSNYVIDESLTPADIIKPLALNENVSIISSGPIPPNPVELLMSKRTADLMEMLKVQFDYIIMDAPPIGIISDAEALLDFAQITVYLVRQRATQKHQLLIADNLYRSRKIKNMGIVVNDVIEKHYGVGYGYGTYGEKHEAGFLDKIIGKFKRS
jgi:tyrosine-protein kinase Etk/Wzc